MKKAIITGLLVSAISIASPLIVESMTNVKAEITTETETEVSITETETTNYVYIICDVTELNTEFFTAEMPNGELHSYHMIADYPIDSNGNPCFELVCFKVAMENQDDFTKYETVTVR